MSRRERSVLIIEEAIGKQIHRLVLEEPYENSKEINLIIEFDDKTEIVIDIWSQPLFGVMHLVRDSKGELEPVKVHSRKPIRALVKQVNKRK
jgi:hypothetical protein